MDVTIAVPTFGDDAWTETAKRAIESAEAQDVPVRHYHGVSLAEGRNWLANAVQTEWIIYLDADDELSPGYVEAMSRATADLRPPLVQYVHPGGKTRPPYMPKVAGHRHICTPDCLAEGNWMVIGTAVRTQLVRDLGWRAWPVYEDYDMWVRCWKAGATIETVDSAIYVAHVRPDSRNRREPIEVRNEVHRMIARANELPVPA